jgi:hypothetical protein
VTADRDSWLHDVDEKPEGLSLDDVFWEIPVPLEVFVSDAAYLANPPLSPIQYDLVQHAERILFPETYPLMAEQEPYWAEPVAMRNMLVAEWGKGGGKDHSARISTLRIAYILLCMKSPQDYFGMPAQDTIHMLNIASNSGQALSAFFTPMTRAVRRGWFADRSSVIETPRGQRRGRAKATPLADRIVFAKNVEAISGHSDAESQEGLNLILGVADEIDAFRTKTEIDRYRGRAARESPRSADAVIKMLRTSASTRFPLTYKNIYISYPRYKGSTIQQLRVRGRNAIEKDGPKSRYYVSGPHATWVVNPRVPGKEVFADDYDKDPAMARAMYECLPERAIDSYFQNMDAFRALALPGEQPITVRYDLTSKMGLKGQVIRTWDAQFTFAPGFVPIQGARYVMHLDMAKNGDRAGVALAHVSDYVEDIVFVEDETGTVSQRSVFKPVVKIDFVTCFEADVSSTPVREIQIRWGRTLALELVKRGFSMANVTYDGWQSEDSRQLLASWGVPTAKVSTDLDESIWKNLRDLAYDNRLEFIFSELLLTELEGLGRFNGKIDHASGASKDLADAVACATTTAIAAGGREEDGSPTAYPGMGKREFETHAESRVNPSDGISFMGTLMGIPLGLSEYGGMPRGR